MHRIVENGEEKTVSFETWQRHTNIFYENDKISSSQGSKNSKLAERKPSIKPLMVPQSKGKPTKPSVQLDSTKDGRESGNYRKKSNNKPSLNIDLKHFVIGSSPKRPIIGGSHYSRALLVDAQPLTQGPGPDNLKYLADVDHLFFKPCRKFPPEIKDFNPKHKRGIWNAGGRCVYYVGETKYFSFKKFRSGFTYEVVDYLGRLVITAKGTQWNFGLRGEVSVTLGNGFLLGTMEQDFLGSNYNIKDGQGRIVYTIQAPCYAPAVPFIVWCFDEEFGICMDDGISEIGKISRNFGDEYPDFKGDCGVEFETSDDNRVKALLLGVYFLVEFQYFKYGGNGVAYFIFMVIGISALAFVLSNGFGFFPSIQSPLVPEEILET